MITEERIIEFVPEAVLKGLAKAYWRGASGATFDASGKSAYLDGVIDAACDAIYFVTGEPADADTVDPLLDALVSDHEDEFREDRPLYEWEKD